MSLTLTQIKTISDFSSYLYGFLPGSGFARAAHECGLEAYWTSMSKQPAINHLLKTTYDQKKSVFCKLVLSIVQNSIEYGSRKSSDVTKEMIVQLNQFVEKLGFKIPELWDREFLDLLPSNTGSPIKSDGTSESANIDELKAQFSEILKLEPNPRGFAFEKFMKNLFTIENLDPRASFRIVGEQIDGSFEFENNTYLLEAKWQDKLTAQDDLLVFYGKLSGKAQWTRGLFISYTGFSQEGLTAFARGKPTNIVGFSGQDLHFVMEGKVTFKKALSLKIRRSAETGDFYTPILNL